MPESRPTHPWFVLRCGNGPAAWNMAADEALLGLVTALGRPVLRFYGWTEPAATFGYFQRFADVSGMTSLRPLIRRPTGGGLVPHAADWTYSVAVPPSDPWHALKAVESYRRVHAWIQWAFEELGVPVQLSERRRKEIGGQCFIGAEQFDVLHEDRKIAGAAQRRTRDGLLIQGSIQPPAGIAARGQFEAAFENVGRRRWHIHWEPFPESHRDVFQERARRLAREKYSRPEYNEGR